MVIGRMSRYWSRKNVVKNLAGLLLAPVVVFMLLRWFERSQVYQPSRDVRPVPADFEHAHEEVWLTAEDGVRLHGYYFPAVATSPRRELVILFSHGNAGNIGHRFSTFDVLLHSGVNLLGYDYRGYGRSDGKPSEEGTYKDLLAAYDWLMSEKGFAADQIIVHGNSLGGGVTSWLPTVRTVGGMILQSTFTSTPDIGKELFPWLPVDLISTIKYDTVNRLPRCRTPVLVIHGPGDTLIPFHHAERNFAAALEPKFLWKLRGDHNDSIADEAEHYLEGFNSFLDFVIERNEGNGKVGVSDE